MTGYEYETKCAKYLEDNGFTQVTITPGSGDQGIDVIAFKEGKNMVFNANITREPWATKPYKRLMLAQPFIPAT